MAQATHIARPLPGASGIEQTHLLARSRYLVLLLFLLAVANGVFLYFMPWLAEDWYAWPIRPPVNAAALGAGYLAGMLATALGAFGVRYWRSVRVLIPPFAVLGLSLLAATLIHADRFRWGYFPTWVWTAVYFALPVGSVAIWIWQERGAPSVRKETRLKGVRAVALVLGIPLLVLAAWLYLRPGSFLEAWPWPITPLLGRAFAAWYLFAGLILVFSGLTLRLPCQAPVAFGTLTLWNLLLLLLPALYWGSMRTGGGLSVWLAAHLLLLLATGWITAMTWWLMRREGYQL